jgi:signal transduction histidine kinase
VISAPGRSPLRRTAALIWLPIVLASTFLAPQPAGSHLVAAILIAAATSVAWVALVLRPDRPLWLTPAAIAVTGLGGVALVALGGRWITPFAFCVVAVLTAGARLPGPISVSVLVVVAGGLEFALQEESTGDLVLVMLLLAAVLLVGMRRRESARIAEERELALAVEARDHQERARTAALAERTRIARDVHDVLAHSLSALSVQLQGARLMLLRDGAPPDTLAQIERAQRLAADGLLEARRAVAVLRCEPADLAAGLQALVAEAPAATLSVDGDPSDLDAVSRETVLRTAQEALSNARKHAPGAPVTVRLSRLDGRTELEVHDRAGAPPVRGPGGYGLTGMAERAALAGGELDVGPTEDGWRVRLVLPQ